MARNYKDYSSITDIAEAILIETLRNRQHESRGWAGGLEELNELKSVLRGYNVYYTCDFFGVWTYKPKAELIG